MSKTALVISGGGSKGAFGVGVLKYITANKPDIRFDILCGTSTGALMMPMVATGDIAALENIYSNTRTEDVIITGNVVERFINNNSLFNAAPLARQVTDVVTDTRYAAILESGREVFLTTVSLQTGRVTYFTTSNTPQLSQEYDVVKVSGPDAFREALLASACQPVFMPPIEVRDITTSPRQFVDGGVREYAPIQLAIDNGATDIYAIVLSPEEAAATNKRFTKVLDILEQTISLFSSDVSAADIKTPQLYNRALQYLEAVKDNMRAAGIPEQTIEQYFTVQYANPFMGKRAVNLHIIRPEGPLGGGTGGLEFNPEAMREMMRQGEAAAEAYFNR